MPGDEVWGLNNCRFAWANEWWTRFFNLHKYENLRRYNYDVERDVEWFRVRPDVRLYTLDAWPELKDVRIANTNIFPVEELAGILARHRTSYHCGSFDWMVAYALALNGVDHIVLHGVSLLIEAGEPISARACLEYWCGVAEGRGVDVTAAPDCDIFSFYHLVKSNLVYGLDDTPIYEDRTKVADVPYKLPDPVA